MASENRINIDIFKAVTRSVAHSEDLDVMTNHLAQLLTAGLDIKGCAIFVLNAITEELEILASFGLSAKYLTKGPLNTPKSINETFQGNPVVIADISKKNKSLQYPEEARKEGIAAIVSLPIDHFGEVVGVLAAVSLRTLESVGSGSGVAADTGGRHRPGDDLCAVSQHRSCHRRGAGTHLSGGADAEVGKEMSGLGCRGVGCR
jgi:hypothetical protein